MNKNVLGFYLKDDYLKLDDGTYNLVAAKANACRRLFNNRKKKQFENSKMINDLSDKMYATLYNDCKKVEDKEILKSIFRTNYLFYNDEMFLNLVNCILNSEDIEEINRRIMVCENKAKALYILVKRSTLKKHNNLNPYLLNRLIRNAIKDKLLPLKKEIFDYDKCIELRNAFKVHFGVDDLTLIINNINQLMAKEKLNLNNKKF